MPTDRPIHVQRVAELDDALEAEADAPTEAHTTPSKPSTCDLPRASASMSSGSKVGTGGTGGAQAHQADDDERLISAADNNNNNNNNNDFRMHSRLEQHTQDALTAIRTGSTTIQDLTLEIP